MSDHSKKRVEQPAYHLDRLFWLALLLAPLCWLALLLLGVESHKRGIPWKTLLWIGLVYPVLEEIVFRGGLQAALYQHPLFKRSIVGISIANVITSLVFAAFHLINQSLFWSSMVFFPSLVFGWARDRYQHVKASVVLHIFYNTGFVLLFSA